MPKKSISTNKIKIFEDLINSDDYQKSSKEFYRSQLILARMNEIMSQKNLTQEELAFRMNMSQPNLSNILSGKKPKFSIDTIIRFCEATDSKLEIIS
jgi:predicted XRE-type DNA-binding protein